MLVRYIKEDRANGGPLTLNREYETCGEIITHAGNRYVHIIDDLGNMWYALEKCFEVVDEDRSIKISW